MDNNDSIPLAFPCNLPKAIVSTNIKQSYLSFHDIAHLKSVSNDYNVYWTTDDVCPEKHLYTGNCQTFACSHIKQRLSNFYNALYHFASTDQAMFWHLFEPCREKEIISINQAFNVKYQLSNRDILNVYLGSFVHKNDAHKIHMGYLQKALREKNVSNARVILNTMRLRPQIFAVCGHNETLLGAICALKDLPLFEILIKRNSKHLNTCDKNGFSVLQTVVLQGTKQMLDALLQYKQIDINLTSRYSRSTALHFAVSAGKKKKVALLCEHGADNNAADNKGNIPLHLAVQKGRSAIVDTLLSYDNKGVNETNKKRTAPLHMAAHRGAIKCAVSLLKNGATLNIQDIIGATPLHIACKQAKVDFVKWLIENGASINLLDSLCCTPLDVAYLSSYKNKRIQFIIKLLEAHQAKRNFIFFKEMF